MAYGSGLCMGPVLGALVFRWVGNYMDTFLLFAACIFVVGLATVVLIPSKVNSQLAPGSPSKNRSGKSKDADQITYSQILSCPRSVVALCATFLAIICLVFMDPNLSIRLVQLGVSDANVGVAFALMGFSFGLGALCAGCLSKIVSRCVVMQVGAILLGASCFLVGPSVLLGLPDSVPLILIGVSMNAFFGAFLIVPVTPEIIEQVGSSLKQKWQDELHQ